jgi:hypothetical protein
MQFVNPSFLWALILVAIPVMVHLFYFRRYKRILFSNTRFLTEITEERSSRNKLKHLLVLFSRIFAIIFLVLAFAQPFIPLSNQALQNEQTVSIFIDNSFSMNAEGSGRILFDEAKSAAKNIIQAYSDNTRFQILTNDFEGRHQRLVSKSEALNLLSEVNISSTSQHFASIFERQKSLLKNYETSKTAFIISDFQENKKLFQNDENYKINLVPLVPSNTRNVYIDSVWFDAPIQLKGQTNTLVVKIRNESNEAVSGNFQLSINGASKAVVNYEISSASYSLDTLSFNITSTGWNKGQISLNDYPITFDDDYFFSFYVEEDVRVLNITETGKTDRIFKAVFQDLPSFSYQSAQVNNINYNEIPDYHLVILDGLQVIPSGLAESLKTFSSQGGNVFVVPSHDISFESYNSFLSAVNAGTFNGFNEGQVNVVNVNYNHAVLIDLFDVKKQNIQLPSAKKYYTVSRSTYSSEEEVLSFKNNNIFLASYLNGFGHIYLLASPLEKGLSDFATNAVFAPVVYKMAVLGVRNPQISFDLEANTLIYAKDIPSGGEVIVKMQNDDFELIPQKMVYGGRIVLNVKGELLKSGFYQLTTENEEMNETVALNYNRDESQLRYYSAVFLKEQYPEENVSVLKGNINKIGESVKMLEQGKTFWKLCIILSLLFLAIEILLLRFLPS